MDCGSCGRPIHADRPACLYCGWAPSSFASSAKGGLLTPPERPPRSFRSGASLVRFASWALLCAAGAWFAWRHGRSDVARGTALGLLLAGPLAFLAYLARALLVRVTVDPAHGLILGGERLIPWDAVDGVEAHGLRFRPDHWLFHQILDLIRAVPVVVGVGPLSPLTLLLRMALGLLLLPAGLLMPMLVLLSPWQPRLVLTLRDGRRKIWRDLRDDLDFVCAVREHRRPREG